MVELASFLEGISFVDIRLEEFAIGVHCSEFIHLEHLAVLPYSVEFYQNTVESSCCDFWTGLTSRHNIIGVTFFAFINDFESAVA